jgi:N-acetylmuramoyl-L-alanine amidase
MTRRSLPLWIALLLALAAAIFWLRRPAGQTAGPAPEAPAAALAEPLSDLGTPPDWSRLNRFQSTITRADFLRQMDEVFTTSAAWRGWFHVADEEVRIRSSSDPEADFRLRFAPDGLASRPPRFWRTAGELPPAAPGRPLDGLKIAIDPGHIGGRWAVMEERWFQIPSHLPVKEGDMTLQVARLLKPQLERLGAIVTLVRDDTEPVTSMRPESLQEAAGSSAKGGDIVKLAERLFYRTAEIRARAAKVNESIQPDLVLCLHFNADAWGDPKAPTLVSANHFHMILNGGYTDDEIALADQRHDLLTKLLQGVHEEEKQLSASVAAAIVERNPMPPYRYNPLAKNHRGVAGNPYLWARNLLANRLYQCPVIYFEPYVMNSEEDHARIQAGDYDGEREVAGKLRPSIFREYAGAAANGLSRHYEIRTNAR